MSNQSTPRGAAPDGGPARPRVVSLEEFLAQRETDLPSILAQVRAGPGLGRDDALVAVGSLVEGLGTTKSDLDLLLVTPRPPGELPASDVVTLVSGKSIVDMRVLRLEQLEALIGRFRSWAGAPWAVAHAARFSIDDRTLLHRVHHGKILQGDAGGRIEAMAPSREELCRLKLHIARQAARTILVDMVGYRDTGDHRSLAVATLELLGHTVDALVAGHGSSNPLLKWRTRLLQSVPAAWEEEVGLRPTGRSASDHVWQLQRLPAAPDPAMCLDHASRVTCTARAVFAWSERRLVRRDLPTAARRRPWPGAGGADGGPPLPFLDDDVDFLLAQGDAVALARLNEFEEPVMVSAEEFAMLLLFDGQTSARQAERAVHGDGPDGRGAAGRLLARLQAARMISGPTIEGAR